MLNHRKVSRYHLLHPLTGYIEHGEGRYRGEIVELSTSGFRLRLPNISREAFIFPKSAHDFGEIIYKKKEIGGFGDIRYVRCEASDLWIGFKWDDIHANANIQTTFSIIAELVSTGSAGCVNVGNGVLELAGHVSSALAEDIQQSISPKFPRISLRECTSIDASGLSMLASLEDAKVQINEASNEVHALLQRYRLRGPASILPDSCLMSVG